MAKEIATKAGVSAAESVLRSLMPELLGQMNSFRQELTASRTEMQKELSALRSEMQKEFRQIDFRIEQLKNDMSAKSQQSLDVINELGHRITRFEGKIEGYFEAARTQDKKIDGWVERIVRLEMQNKRRKAS